MNGVQLAVVILFGLFLAFVLLTVFCSLAIEQKADDNDLNDDESCEWCGSADDVTCEECKARRGIK